jgi:Ser/Thr protein kinase RdoA (MazF antagonist)
VLHVLPGPRGATAQVRQVVSDAGRFALKIGRGERPTAELVTAQLAFNDASRHAGIRMPGLHADRDGRWVIPGPGGTWLRLYDWVEARPADLSSPSTAVAVGELMARLHAAAPAMSREADGAPPDPWYERAPAMAELEVMLAADAWWSPRLAERLHAIPALVEVIAPSDHLRLVACHRDLHPGNVAVDETGALVVLDQDDVGPADPARELGRALFDWWSDPGPDIPMMRTMYLAYREAGGPAGLGALTDFTMLVAQRLNFLLGQLRVSVDPTAEPTDRAWADQEIDEALRILPTVEQLDAVLATLAG